MICGLLLFFIVVAVICRLRKNKNEDSGIKQTLYDALIAFLVFIFILILINACFLVAKKINFIGESVLQYNEAQQMVISALVAGCIAFFQFEIQKAIDRKNSAESEQRKKFHIKEINSERIKEMQIYSEISAYALNFNIPSCRVIHAKQYNEQSEVKFFIRIFATNERKQIYPHYFKPNDKDAPDGYGIKVEVIDLGTNTYKYEICPEHIDISFLGGFDKLDNFFTAPTLVDGEQVSLDMKIIYNGNDTSYVEEDYSKIKFNLSFQLIPHNGYDENGKFDIKIIQPLISTHHD